MLPEVAHETEDVPPGKAASHSLLSFFDQWSRREPANTSTVYKLLQSRFCRHVLQHTAYCAAYQPRRAPNLDG